MRALVPAVALAVACGGHPSDTVTISVTMAVPRVGAGSRIVVASDPPGIACDAATIPCAAEFPRGTRVRLRAPHDPVVGHIWGGVCASSQGSELCAFDADQDRRVPISLAGGLHILPAEHPLGVAIRGEGRVIGSNVAIVCPPFCEAVWVGHAAFPASITAEPAAGWVFTGWQDDCHGIETCVLREGVLRASAIFEPAPPASRGGR